MSGWDWLHAGLEVATYAQAQKAQRNLTEMKTAVEIEAARRLLLEAMKSFIFDISRDIQLAEEQIAAFPQQVYIVARSLELRFASSGLSAEVFPDFQDKEYVFKTQKKIGEVVGKSKLSLTQPEIERSETAVQYIAEMPLLQQAITAKTAQECIVETDEQWKKVSSRQGRKNLFIALGVLGIGLTVCGACPMVVTGYGMVATGLMNGDFGALVGGAFTMLISLLIPAGTVVVFILSGRSSAEFAPLKAQRQGWQKQLLPQADWQQVVSTFGDLPSETYKKMYEERFTFLSPLLGTDFQKFLGTDG